MCSETVAMKMDLVNQLGIVLHGTVKPSKESCRILVLQIHAGCTVITQCCIVELYKLGRPGQAAVDLAKTFERRKCNHREAIPGDDCLESVVGTIQISQLTRDLTKECRRDQQTSVRDCYPITAATIQAASDCCGTCRSCPSIRDDSRATER